jgi:hypothetical protein
MTLPLDSRARHVRLVGRARRGENPICPRRAVLACLAFHAPRSVALADLFSIQQEVRFAISLAGDDSDGLLIYSICAQCRPVSSYKFLERMNGQAQATCICAEICISIEGAAARHGKDPTMAIPIRAFSNVTFNECKGLLEMGNRNRRVHSSTWAWLRISCRLC